MQGDVVGIVRAGTGQVVARYSYDAWGNCMVTNASGFSVGRDNPFRYRGYYYDAETGFYYLNSRYYNPEWGRFISADVFVSTGQGLTGANMFAYCGNNPVNRADPSGALFITTAILIGSAILGGGAAIYTGYKMREAGANWADTLLYSAGVGLGVFSTVYTFGMSAYELYYNMSLYYGYTPATEIGSKTQATVPQEAYDTYDYVLSHNGTPPQGYKGGAVFANDGRSGSAVLPEKHSPFREYDIYPKMAGALRGTERIVVGFGSGGAAWYTNNHYKSFILMDR